MGSNFLNLKIQNSEHMLYELRYVLTYSKFKEHNEETQRIATFVERIKTDLATFLSVQQ